MQTRRNFTCRKVGGNVACSRILNGLCISFCTDGLSSLPCTQLSRLLFHNVTQDLHHNLHHASHLHLQGLQKNQRQRYESTTFSPEYRTANSTHPYKKIDIGHLVCKNTGHYHQIIINITESEISSCLHTIEEREKNQFLKSSTNKQHTP